MLPFRTSVDQPVPSQAPLVFFPATFAIAWRIIGSYILFAGTARSSLAPGRMIRRLLATDPVLLGRVRAGKKRRTELILNGLMPISRKVTGLRNDGGWAGPPLPTACQNIAVATLILSCEDDLFAMAETSRLLADRISEARLVIYPDGGHIWLGHDAEVADEIADFLRPEGGRGASR